MDRRSLISPANITHNAGLISSALETIFSPNAPELSLIHIKRRAMATDFEISFPLGTKDAVLMAEDCLDLISVLENQLSVYIEKSEVVNINQYAGKTPVIIEPNLFYLLQKAKSLSHETNQGFDITAGKLVKLWGFFKGPKRVPSEIEIINILSGFGSDSLILDPSKKSVFFCKPEMEINLGAIGKGYALDRVKGLLLNKFGVSTFMIHGGKSSIVCGSSLQNQQKGWPIAINHPWQPNKRIATIYLENRALGISAATYNFESNGFRYGHILNPKTGYPANGVATCVVAAGDATSADALSTAFFVLGADAAIQYCEKHKEVGILILPENEKEQVLVVGNLAAEF
jgi:thiamine biosynthesis lipoprotein